MIIMLRSNNSKIKISKDLNRYVWWCFEHEDKTESEKSLIQINNLLKKHKLEYPSWNSLNKCRKLRDKIQIHMK